jgi:UDP-N-acetylglucosamine 1-carboxyvinyltransferase
MTSIRVRGKTRLQGEVAISGSKYVALAAIPAILLTPEPSTLENVPDLSDVQVYGAILQQLGAKVEKRRNTITVDPGDIKPRVIEDTLAKRLRASYYLLGVLLGRFHEAAVALPGGDAIGTRPIDQHVKGLKALGAEIAIEHGVVFATAPHGLKGASVYLDVASVGATANTMMAAVYAEGTTTIVNAYRAPFIVDLANLLTHMGAHVSGAGTETIRIQGVPEMHGCRHTLIPDQSEAATFMIAAAMTQGDVLLRNTIPHHMDAITAKLQEVGAQVDEEEDGIRVRGPVRPRAANVTTLPYPGFFTDYQAPMSSLLTVADGVSIVTETIWDERFKHLDEMVKMGAHIRIDGRTAVIEGVPRLSGAEVTGTDIRASSALVLAGLLAEGETVVHGFEHADRGYEHLEKKLSSLGAQIKREKD